MDNFFLLVIAVLFILLAGFLIFISKPNKISKKFLKS